MTGILWGMLQAGSPSSATTTIIDADAGKRPSVYIFASTWYTGTYPSGSYNTAGVGSTVRNNLNTVAGRGAIPQIDWFSDLGNVDTAFSLKAIYSQKLHDAFLVQFAKDIAAYGAPIMIRLNAEMNGGWHGSYYDKSGFGSAPNTNAVGDFKLMWQYVHNIFVANGATNVAWLWCPNYQPPAGSVNVTYASIYPGSAYVDWLGLDMYNWGGSQPGGGKTSPWFTFEQCMRAGGTAAGWLGDSWTELTALDANLPCFLGEFGCDTREGTDTNASAGTTAVWNGQKKADWFTDAFGTQIPGKGATDYSRLKYVAYFNTTDAGAAPPIAGGFTTGNGDWPIEDPTAASGKAGGGIPQTTFQGANGPGGATYYVAGNAFTLPSGLVPVRPYEAIPQPSRFTNAIQHTAPGHLVGWWKLNDTIAANEPAAALADAPAGDWRLNESSGTVATDSSSNSLNGTYTGGFTLGAAGPLVTDAGTGVTLNGTTGYVSIPHNAALSITGDMSLEIDVYPTTRAGYQMVITKTTANGAANDNYELYLNITSGLPTFQQFTTSVQSVTGTVAPALNTWSRLGVSKSGTTVTHYLNGAPNGTGTITGTPTTNTLAVLLGNRPDAVAGQFFNGRLANGRIYPSALSAARFLNHYQQGQGPLALDSSGNGRNGVYVGGYSQGQPKIVRGALDLSVLFDGLSGRVTLPDDPSYSLATTGQLTLAGAFNFASLSGAHQNSIVGRSNVAGTVFEYVLRVSSTGALEGVVYSSAGLTYSDVAFGAGTVAAGTTCFFVWTLNQSRTPIGRLGIAAAGNASLSFLNSADTPANAPSHTASILDWGRRPDDGSYANAFESHGLLWNVAISDLSANELLKAFNTRRANPRVYVG